MSDVLLWYASLLPLLVMQAKRWLEIETLDGAIAAVRFADRYVMLRVSGFVGT